MFVMHNPVRYVDPTGLIAIPSFIWGNMAPGTSGSFVSNITNSILQSAGIAMSPVHYIPVEIDGGGGSIVGGGGSSTVTQTPTIISRDSWGALPATFPVFTQDVTRIVMHHTVTATTRYDPRYGRGTVAEMVRWIDALHHGWGNRGVGYHFLIGYDGSIYQGRPMDVEGRHAMHGYRANRNPFTIGISLIGDFSGNNIPVQAQLDSLFWLTDHILGAIPTIDTIECHWFTYFGPWYSDVQDDLRRLLR